MKRTLRWTLVLSTLAFAHQVAYAGILDFLVGDTVKKVAEVSLGFYIVSFLKSYMPLISVLIVAGLAIACFYGAVRIIEGFEEELNEAQKDGKIVWSEWFWLIATYLPSIAIILALLWFGGLFGWAASQGMLDLIHYKPR